MFNSHSDVIAAVSALKKAAADLETAIVLRGADNRQEVIDNSISVIDAMQNEIAVWYQNGGN